MFLCFSMRFWRRVAWVSNSGYLLFRPQQLVQVDQPPNSPKHDRSLAAYIPESFWSHLCAEHTQTSNLLARILPGKPLPNFGAASDSVVDDLADARYFFRPDRRAGGQRYELLCQIFRDG